MTEAEQIASQEQAIRLLWHKLARVTRQRDYWRRVANTTDGEAAKPTYRDKLVAEAEAIFRGSE